MGLIFPWEAVRDDLVPSIHDFEGCALRAIEIFGANPRVIKGSAFIGSLPRGDIRPRSDLDLIVVCFDSRFHEAVRILKGLRDDAQTHGVALEAKLVRSSWALGGRHPFGPSYTATFDRMASRVCIGVPLSDCFRIPGGSIRREMLSKMERKRLSTLGRDNSLQRIYPELLSVDRWLQRSWQTIRRPMRVHVTIGRWVLWWLDEQVSDYGKVAVTRSFLDDERLVPFHRDYRELVDLDLQYDDLLATARSRQVRKRGYLRGVRRLLRQNLTTSRRLLNSVVGFMRKVGDRPAAIAA